MLHDHNVRALIQCKGNFGCAFNKSPTRLMFNAIPVTRHKQLLRQSALKNDQQSVVDLIRFGVDSKWLDYPLKRALYLGLQDQAQWICALLPHDMKSVSVIDLDPAFDPEILIEAAREGDLFAVKRSINDGIDMNWKTMFPGRTALMFAASNNHEEIVRALIDAGADINIKSSHGTTALMQAALEGHLQITKALIEAGADVDDLRRALPYAISNRHIEVVKALIEAGVNVNANIGLKSTPLFNAAYAGTAVIAQLLIEAGADVRATNKHGYTALSEAAKKGNVEVAKVLLLAS